MPFVTAAREFLEDPGELSDNKYLDVMYDTVSYLLSNAIGLENAKPTDKIIEVLNANGHDINRHQWEILVLGKLREEGVFIASNKTKGMYLINSIDEAERFYFQYAKRIARQKARLEFLRDLIDHGRWLIMPINGENGFGTNTSGSTVHISRSKPKPKSKKR
jgi:hypothetical protein